MPRKVQTFQPAEQDLEMHSVVDQINQLFSRKNPFGAPRARRQFSRGATDPSSGPIVWAVSTSASIGELVLCNPVAAMSVHIPSPKNSDAGEVLTIVNTTGLTNTITVIGDDILINGSSTATISAAYGVAALVVVGEGQYVRVV